ncbi:hypothetical protein LTR05_004404 [Lithohypha guttulata]|uniref:Monopolin complex subunit Csm1/Pcs1 C-terminal domain-containing protein n=1 Tax=Lithohypha guttulata TaxID=1690604 RepID=A0AAN7T3G2_9EURO|nr:hypothetical protein LTR05_004404 [Lithohypha guttulata]
MPGISALLDYETEEPTSNFVDENSLISSVSEDTLASLPQTKPAVAKSRKRKCVTIPKKPRAKAAPKAEKKTTTKSAGAKRKAAEIDAVEDEDSELVEPAVPQPKKKPTRKKTVAVNRDDDSEVAENHAPQPSKALKEKDANIKPVKARGNKKTSVQNTDETEEEVVQVRSDFAQTKLTKPLPKPVSGLKSKPATKRPVSSAPEVTEVVSDEDAEENAEPVEQQPPKKKTRTEIRPRQEHSYCRRAGSVSDTERGDPMLRRKLGDMTRKYESIDLKYRNLKDLAVTEANANVEKLRKQCEAITEASDRLIASLKKQLAQQTLLVQESRKQKQESRTQEAETSKLRTENNSLSAELSAAKIELKSLQAKLATARATPVPAETKQQPTNAKTAVATRIPISSQAQHAKEAQLQLKIDLYGDLTGLIVQSVKQSEEGDTYDCLQTGRNGTLHFKLFVDRENAKTAGFEQTEFLYSPQLDTNRDRELLEIMPDYLTEDITFVRDVAEKFYARVVRTLTEKPEPMEEEAV